MAREKTYKKLNAGTIIRNIVLLIGILISQLALSFIMSFLVPITWIPMVINHSFSVFPPLIVGAIMYFIINITDEWEYYREYLNTIKDCFQRKR